MGDWNLRHSFYGEALESMDNDQMLIGFEEELKLNDKQTEWWLNHNMIAAEEIGDMLDVIQGAEAEAEIIQFCRKQIDLLREYGYSTYADRAERMMNNGLKRHGYAA